MNRRNSIKAIAAGSVGIAAIGYWAKDRDYVRDLLSNSFFKPTEQDILTSMVDTIIPKGEFYGAVDLGVPIFLLGYLERCTDSQDQLQLKLQLDQLDQSARKKFGKKFVKCAISERELLLLDLESSEDQAKSDFFKLVKNQTVRGFMTTEEVMTHHYYYRLVPGHYFGCIDMEEETVS